MKADQRQLLLFRQDVLRPGVRGGRSVYQGHRGVTQLMGPRMPPPPKAEVVKTAPGDARPLMDSPMIVAYGAGVDSTAVLVEMVKRGTKPDAILFADPGNENPETYAYLPIMDGYLRAHGFPGITVVRYVPPQAPYRSLGEAMVYNETIPSAGLGVGHSCSVKWKIKPQNNWVRTWQPALDATAAGRPVVKVIGYDDSDRDLGRAKRAARTYTEAQHEDSDPINYAYWYPLQEWGIDREECKRRIAEAGLPIPPKSACYFCPVAHEEEIVELAEKHPELAARAIAMEDRALGGKHPLRAFPGLGFVAKRTWRSIAGAMPTVQAELAKLKVEERFGSVLTFEHHAGPDQEPDRTGTWRLDVDETTPELLAQLVKLTHGHGRVMLGRGQLSNWDDILARYEDVVRAVGPKFAKRLYVEMPGVMGDQDATLRLVRHYAPRIRSLIERNKPRKVEWTDKPGGVRALVPVMPGGRPLSAAYRATVLALGTRDFSALVPSTVSDYHLQDLASEHPGGIHLYGTRPVSAVSAIRAVSPPTSITADRLVKCAALRWAA